MLKSLRKELTVQSETVECNRCDLCGQSDGAHVRLACGHSACSDCVAVGECQVCEQLMEPTYSRPRSDDPTTERTNNTEQPALQDTFQSAVYQKQRLSERLRVEKELFPECIQAPAKYYNKRKSLNVSKRDKENRHTTVFPGEETSSREHVMNKSRNFVQEWLNKQPHASFGPQARSPFSDLKVNTRHHQPAHSTPIKGKQKENAPKLPTRVSNRKRPRLKETPSASSLTSLENYLKLPEKGTNKKAWTAKRMKQEFDDTSTRLENKQPCDESGIVIDDDCYTIEDSQDQTVDKDRLALLEVQKANRREFSQSIIVIGETDDNHSVNEEASISINHDEKCVVPFYKKSLLFENCTQCITPSKDTLIETKHESLDNTRKSSEVSITIENKSFTTTITVVDCDPVNSGKKQSIEVQTDVTEPFMGFERATQTESASLIAKMKEIIETEDILPSRKEQVPGTDSQKTSCTDVLMQQNGGNKADRNVVQDTNVFGYSSEHDFGVLTELDGAGFQNKRRRGPRGATPDSNNSSDKENYDPNRKKKRDSKKKKKNKQ